mgnify:CR=1 FL=1
MSIRYSLVPRSHSRTHWNRLFDEFFQGFGLGAPAASTSHSLLVNAWEEEEHFVVEAEVPGFTMKDLELSVHQGLLKIAGKRESDQSDDQAEYRRRERRSSSFERALRLPKSANAEEIKATLSHGVLTVVLPKVKEAMPRQIPVNEN